MKRILPIIGIGLLFLAACTKPAGTLPGTVEKKTYVNTTHAFTFDYPADWQILDKTDEGAALGLIAWMYEPDAAKALKACEGMETSPDQLLRCGQAEANAAISIVDYGFIDYDSLEDWDKTNYPDHQKMRFAHADGFAYTTTSDPPHPAFHINNPDGTSGVSLMIVRNALIKDTTDAMMAVAKDILSTFAFTAK
ncbi:MAG: hypothetical protein HOO67_06740 [Candidatus Peribacteraceae bacterium]|nr:hypothetical protein [Candidatus Peribacteraceae bacterium]